MGDFMEKCCTVAPLLNLRDHPILPHLQVAEVAGRQIVVGRHYDEGVLGIFIPDGALVPDKLASEMWVLGKLAGKSKNRVKATTRDGVYSSGLFYGSRFFGIETAERVYVNSPSWNPRWAVGQDVAEEIGVTFS